MIMKLNLKVKLKKNLILEKIIIFLDIQNKFHLNKLLIEIFKLLNLLKNQINLIYLILFNKNKLILFLIKEKFRMLNKLLIKTRKKVQINK